MDEKSNPLMIRGDRLLLAFDVMLYITRYCRVLDCSYYDWKAARDEHDFRVNPRYFSRPRTLEVIQRRLGVDYLYPCWRNGPHNRWQCEQTMLPPDPFKDEPAGILHEFLMEQARAGVIGAQTFSATKAINALERIGQDYGFFDPSATRRLVFNIACGELTEADFRRKEG